MEISVCIDYRVVANTGGVLRVLHSKLSDDGRVGRCSVARKVAHVGTDLGAQHFGNVKQKVDIAICRECRHRVNGFVAAHLVGKFVLPIKYAPMKILVERDAQ